MLARIASSLLGSGQTLVEDVLVAHLLAPEDSALLVEPDLEAGVLLPQVLDLHVELPAFVLDHAVQPDDHPRPPRSPSC